MPVCLPQQCLALVNGLPPPGDPLFRESPGWWVRLQSVGRDTARVPIFLCLKTFKISGNRFMPICLPQQCLALVNGLPPPGDPLFRESPGWWVRLQSVGHRHRACSHVFVVKNFENFRKLFYAYMSTPAMPGPCEWAPTPWRSLVQGESRVVGQAAECRPQTQSTCSHVFVPEKFHIFSGNCFMPICLPQQCLALVYGLPLPGDPLFRESTGWLVRLQSVGHRHSTCSHVFVPENFENFRKLFYAYMSTPAMPGPCVWAPTPWRSLVQGESRVVGQAAECRPQTQHVFPCFCARKL